MQTVSIQKAHKLSRRVKSPVEELLGRPIDDDEEVSVIAVPPQHMPPFSNRAAVAQKLEAFLNQRSKKTMQISDEEIDAAVDEGVDHVRGVDSCPRYQHRDLRRSAGWINELG